MTPGVMGPACQTFGTPARALPMSPDASVNLLEVLRLVPMEDTPPPPPGPLTSSSSNLNIKLYLSLWIAA